MFHIPCPSQAGPMHALLFGKIPLTVDLTEEGHCSLTLAPAFLVRDQDTLQTGTSLVARPGTSFVLQYSGRECEVRVGRRIFVSDAS